MIWNLYALLFYCYCPEVKVSVRRSPKKQWQTAKSRLRKRVSETLRVSRARFQRFHLSANFSFHMRRKQELFNFNHQAARRNCLTLIRSNRFYWTFTSVFTLTALLHIQNNIVCSNRKVFFVIVPAVVSNWRRWSVWGGSPEGQKRWETQRLRREAHI